MAREKAPQVFARHAPEFERAKQAFDGVRNFAGKATIANRTRDGREGANAAADAKVVGVHEFAMVTNFFAFDADVGDPVLSATVRAAGHVELQIVRELRQAVF